MQKNVAIIGAGLAGANVARALREKGFDGRVWLIGEETHVPYQRPPLSKECLIERDAVIGRVALHDSAFYVNNNIELLLGGRVTRVDPQRGTLTYVGGAIGCIDSFVLCTGGAARRLQCRGGDDGVLYLRTLEDAAAISSRLQSGASVAVVGAGLIGCEIAASAAKLGCETFLIESAPAMMLRTLDAVSAARAEKLHRDHGVIVLLRTAIEKHERCGPRHVLALTDDRTIEADVVVAGIGLAPNIELARAAGAEIGDGILVDGDLRTTKSNMFALGDIANAPNSYYGGSARIESFPNACDQAERVASALLGATPSAEEPPWGWTDQYGINIQMIGFVDHNAPVLVRGDLESESFCVFSVRNGVLRGAVGFNRAPDMAALRRLMKARTPIQTDVLADDRIPARELVKASQRMSLQS
ncbi:MAG: FAD-dependent oxidoreductase [Hyphomonadaceae bacterium]|nr:FAD-dependent oxidoreductase [Hyphomonadaceae bacterium]